MFGCRARRTGRMEHIIHHLGLALGGRPAASFAQRLMLPVSNGLSAAQQASQPAQFVNVPLASAGVVSAASRSLALDLPLREARDAFERAYFEHHLAREHGSMTRVAEKTGLERTHLYRKLKQLGIDLSKGAYRKGGVVSQ